VLGLFDAYAYTSHIPVIGEYINPATRPERTSLRDVMLCDWAEEFGATDNNIEMSLWAWKNGKLQVYEYNAFVDLFGAEVSQAFYH
jgi:hypothetical protein